MKKIKVTSIGGGSGQFALLSSLRDIKNLDISSVVSMVDSGGSTGRLRDELGILPPGDVLKCLLALSPNRESARKLLQARFKSNKKLKGHNAGNMLLSVLSQYSGSFSDGIEALGEILNIKGRVLPVTTNRATLVAELSNGERIFGEAAIDIPRGDQREKIVKTFLSPHHTSEIKAHPPVIDYIKNADYVIVGPGDIYTSIIPNFLVPGVKEAIKESRAKIIYITNIMTKFGESDSFEIKDFVDLVEETIGQKINMVVQNERRPEDKVLNLYKEQKAFFVSPIEKKDKKTKYIKTDILDDSEQIIRHDKQKLAKILEKILNNKYENSNI
ncbi:hypothetical protein C0584_00595 [Candidatus Parcubacteria bacterium]|nr:MAG: hypothetical protein C0584_00595 [Candidatus Parcubacteria bacterium]